MRRSLRRDLTDREELAHRLYEGLHPVMATLGLFFFVLVLAQRAAREGSSLHLTLVAATWVVWAVFVADYVLRAVLARDTFGFLKRTWWQLAFLVVPVLSMARAALVFRLARPTRVVLAAVRGTRSAGRKLTDRVAWLALVSAVVVFASADLVYEVGGIRPYGRALHVSAKAAIAAEPLPEADGVTAVLDVAMSLYSMVVFAALAGTLGAFFLERRSEFRSPGPMRAPGRASVDY